jgi:hypothetical protein
MLCQLTLPPERMSAIDEAKDGFSATISTVTPMLLDGVYVHALDAPPTSYHDGLQQPKSSYVCSTAGDHHVDVFSGVALLSGQVKVKVKAQPTLMAEHQIDSPVDTTHRTPCCKHNLISLSSTLWIRQFHLATDLLRNPSPHTPILLPATHQLAPAKQPKPHQSPWTYPCIQGK